MGEIKKGILGGVSGLVGTVVGASFRGLDILRSRPKKSSKKAVQSQINQRTKFGLITNFLGHFNKYIKIGYKAKSKLHSPMNSAVQYNLLNAITGIAPNFQLDYGRILLTDGSLRGVDMLSLKAIAGGKYMLTWDLTDDGRYTPDEKAIRDTDLLKLALWCEETGYTVTGQAALRSQGTLTSRLVNAETGEKVHVWFFVHSSDEKLASRSVYAGSVIALD